ncbi:hypothetical protein [Actinopolymorpha pittospori]|uniref:Lipoprotein n=1 Tax=Actinopolymorpha pittospori TaxID=648752 RepID=A0A927RQG5_9ACTN|nr:hypothetical protein [Actinopolymorpha pittospori]MBE1613081.1 hypothetical protein [Actinopolymorpha pittospori]
MKRQMISGCAVAAAVLAALAVLTGCTQTPALEAAPEERPAAKSVIEIESSGLEVTRPDWALLTCAVFRTHLTDGVRAYVLAGFDAHAMDVGLRNAARALAAAAAAGDARAVAKLESGMRTACYAYESSLAVVAGSIGHSYEAR